MSVGVEPVRRCGMGLCPAPSLQAIILVAVRDHQTSGHRHATMRGGDDPGRGAARPAAVARARTWPPATRPARMSMRSRARAEQRAAVVRRASCRRAAGRRAAGWRPPVHQPRSPAHGQTAEAPRAGMCGSGRARVPAIPRPQAWISSPHSGHPHSPQPPSIRVTLPRRCSADPCLHQCHLGVRSSGPARGRPGLSARPGGSIGYVNTGKSSEPVVLFAVGRQAARCHRGPPRRAAGTRTVARRVPLSPGVSAGSGRSGWRAGACVRPPPRQATAP